ncbi:MAG: propionyl-CoA carboxylase alpha chain [Saprospiraceae bacterium]|jgi:propionyl-CoA carboxylase alpha chain
MKPIFDKILIANRGEIACRAMRTAKRMGIKTVAVYSDADARALHVKHADEAHYLGGNAPSESYLNIDKIIALCKQTGAEAVYPGYGFLSENAHFAQALDAAGIGFIGPNVKAITIMGDKITSKKLASKAGVNCIPGYTDVIKDAAQALQIANDIGYPVMLKASAGGGGKGMRVAYNDEECLEGFTRAASEAATSFGDDRIFLEKFIEQPRHIEIQVIADSHGKVLTLNERECSVQRRHQKVIEEAPSPFIDEATRAAMSQQAVLLSKAVDYVSAGTVELIVDKDKNFYFLEMNTRLQVEHPVTEMITGLDLIELMIRVAAGEALPLEQSDVRREGWSVECRVYAENPARNFMPSIGRLSRYMEPSAALGARVDTGIEEGAEISMFYDPMISKLVTHASNREQAISAMQQALNEYYIEGVDTNINFLSAILQEPRFQSGEIDTNFIDTHFPEGYSPSDNCPDDLSQIAAIIATLHFRYRDRAAKITNQVPHTQHTARRDWVAITNKDTAQAIDITGEGGDFTVKIAKQDFQIKDTWKIGNPLYSGEVNGKKISLQINRADYRFTVNHQGYTAQFQILTPGTAALASLMPVKTPPDLSKFLLSPMPGLLVSMNPKVGDSFEAGQELAVVEAMKMENSLRAENACTVKAVHAKPGEILEVDALILEFE